MRLLCKLKDSAEMAYRKCKLAAGCCHSEEATEVASGNFVSSGSETQNDFPWDLREPCGLFDT